MQYKTGLPIRGLLPVLIESLKSFSDGWWLKIIILAAVLGLAPLLKNHFEYFVAGAGSITVIYTIALWRSHVYSRQNGSLLVKSGLAEKSRTEILASKITRTEIERDQWCLLLRLLNVSIFTEGSVEPTATIRYVTTEQAKGLLEDSLPDDASLDQPVFHKLTVLDAVKATCLVPTKQLLVPAMVVLALLIPLIDPSAERADQQILKEGAIDNVSTLFTTAIAPGIISAISVLVVIFLVFCSLIARVAYALPFFLRTSITLNNREISVRSGILGLRHWKMRVQDIVAIEVRNGFWSRCFNGTALVLQTRGSEISDGMNGNYIPYLPFDKVNQLLSFVGIEKTELPERRYELTNFFFAIARSIIRLSPIAIGFALILPASFWTSSQVIYFSIEIAVLSLAYSLWIFRQHFNSRLTLTENAVGIGQRRWTENQVMADRKHLYGIEIRSLPWWRNRVISVRPGLPGVDEDLTGTSRWDIANLLRHISPESHSSDTPEEVNSTTQ